MTTDMNRCTLRGTISSVTLYKTCAIIRLQTDGGRATSPITNFPAIVLYDKQEALNYGKGDRIEIHGHMQTWTRLNRATKKLENIQNIVADMIFPAKRLLIDYIPELEDEVSKTTGARTEDVNRGYIVGKVFNIVRLNDGMSLLVLEARTKGKENRVSMSCFQEQFELTESLKKGDRVAAATVIRTRNTIKDGERAVEQFVVCRDLAKLED